MIPFHDNVFLEILQQWYYAQPLLSGAVVVFLLAGVPAHRRLAQFVSAVVFLWCLTLILLYGHFRESPGLACVSMGAMAWALVRQLTLSARHQSSQAPPSRLRFPARLLEGAVRDYFRADPRCVYWLDLARASRGLPLERTAAERRRRIEFSFELSDRQAIFWHRVLPGLIEFRIWILRWLPGWWKLPAESISLNEQHIRLLLQEEIEATERLMLESEAGSDFQEYVNRVVREEHAAAIQRAGALGRKRCHLTEALIESLVFVQGEHRKDKTLLEAATLSYQLWRFRWAHDRLWAGLEADGNQEPEPQAELMQAEATRRRRPEPALATASASEDDLISPPVADWETQEEGSPWESESDSELDEFEDLGEFATEELDGFDDDEPEAMEHEDDGEWSEEGDSEDDPGGADDRIAFESLVTSEGDSTEGPGAVLSMDALSQARLDDLSRACGFLENWLGIELTGDFSQDVRQLEELRHRPVNWLATTWLLMLLCLRDDCGRGRADRSKNAVVSRLSHWSSGLASGDQIARQVKSRFQEMLIDWFALRDGYTQIRERFSQSAPRTAWQWELLGRANANIARNMRDHGGLRDDVLRDATIAFFRAGVTGFWTQRYAGLLLGTTTAEDTIRILQEHRVEFGRSELDRMLDSHGRSGSLDDAPTDTSQASAERESPASETQSASGRTARRKNSQKAGPSSEFQPVLEIRKGEKVQQMKLTSSPVSLGSAGDNSIRSSSLDDHHCRLHLKNGRLLLEDLTQGFGVRVQGKLIEGTVSLNQGDVFQCGKIRFRVKSL